VERYFTNYNYVFHDYNYVFHNQFFNYDYDYDYFFRTPNNIARINNDHDTTARNVNIYY